MPQFEFATVFWPQLIWLAIFFAILYFGVVQLTLPKLGKVITAREDQMTGDLASAEKAQAEATQLGLDYDAGVAAAQDAARAQLVAARLSATTAVEGKLAAANAALDEKAATAQAALDAARNKALAEIETVAAEAATAIVEKLTGNRPADADAVSAARAALA
ncbi:MAG: hypothetical protein B7Y43_08095 [Sphingomonas sp. 28-62-20]|uniref:F0F1 ATP synthase subunit B family protein n=1 Tax=Sphingomonas sp. 28-62-20 TaxID=1970433 RepID=UPI000A0B7F14|nr:MAG: hypothetical protein BVN33_15865 [Proteobacteria bacterium ST_bin13]OYY77893.1 MAG: hypothetical protein B7Y43_08095 [Sphingomonas sp. 28-62-20]